MPNGQQIPEMTVEQAQGTLHATVRCPVFFNKLAADHDIVPQTEKEAQQLLDLSDKLRVAQSQEHTKSAGQRNEFLSAASAELDRANQGEPQHSQGVQEELQRMSYDPVLKEAALTLQDAVAANIWVEQQRQNH